MCLQIHDLGKHLHRYLLLLTKLHWKFISSNMIMSLLLQK